MTNLPGKAPRVALMQPTFMPWLGYFSLINDADIFVFLDDFQYTRRSFDSRNRILTEDGQTNFISIPIIHTGNQDLSFKEARLDISTQFYRKTAAKLEHSYRKCTYFGTIFPLIESWLSEKHESLAVMNIDFICKVCELLGFETQYILSSNLESSGRRSARILSLLKTVGAQTYLSARGSFEYMVEDALFPEESCEVFFQNFNPVPYPQRHAPEFVSHLSVLDALMQIGPEATHKNIQKRGGIYDSWNERITENNMP